MENLTQLRETLYSKIREIDDKISKTKNKENGKLEEVRKELKILLKNELKELNKLCSFSVKINKKVDVTLEGTVDVFGGDEDICMSIYPEDTFSGLIQDSGYIEKEDYPKEVKDLLSKKSKLEKTVRNVVKKKLKENKLSVDIDAINYMCFELATY